MPHQPSLLRRLRPEWPRFALGIVCLAATTALGMAIPRLLREAIDGLAAGGAGIVAQVSRAALLIMALAAVQAAIRTVSRILIFNAGRNVEYRLRGHLFGELCRRPPVFYQNHPIGDVMSRLTNDLSAVRMLLGPGILNIANTAIVYIVGLRLMWAMSPRLTIVALLPFPLVIVFGRLSSRTLYRASRDLQEQLGAIGAAIAEDLAGMSTVRTYRLETARQQNFARLNEGYLQKSLHMVRARGALTPVFALVGGMGTLIVLWLGGHEVILGHMTVGALVAFNAYLVYLSWPTLALGWVMALWQRGIAGWTRVRDLLAEDASSAPAPAPPVDSEATPQTPPRINVQHLTIVRGSTPVLHDVSFEVAPGSTVALVGRTGSGKSTVLDAMLGFIDVPRGAFLIDGRDVRDISLHTFRKSVGYAPQEAFLFSASINENIAFGGDKHAHDILAVAHIAGLQRDLAGFADGLGTVVGERGVTLSGGQRQRVALARALCADPKLLVLDDSLSAVDVDTEREILHRLRPFSKSRTTLIVSHRVAAVREADQIIVLHQGRIAESGTHPALMAARGPYAAIYAEQERGEALSA